MWCIAYKDCDSSDDDDSKNVKNGNSSAESTESDDTDEDDADFFGLTSKTKVTRYCSDNCIYLIVNQLTTQN